MSPTTRSPSEGDSWYAWGMRENVSVHELTDDGVVPNNERCPLLVYADALSPDDPMLELWQPT